MSFCKERDCIFIEPPSKYLEGRKGNVRLVNEFLQWFSESHLKKTFYELCVDSFLNEVEVLKRFSEIRSAANKLKNSDALVVVFLNEVNTSSILNLFKEVIVDHSLNGDRLEGNVVIVAACNPSRRKSTTQAGIFRENNLGKEWASVHYQVFDLPKSMSMFKWQYGALSSTKEKEFTFQRFMALKCNIPDFLATSMYNLVLLSHESIRKFAAEHIHRRMLELYGHASNENNGREKSVISLRDIQRVFNLFHFFTFNLLPIITSLPSEKLYQDSILRTIAVVYYLRLDSHYRKKLLENIDSINNNYCTGKKLYSLLTSTMEYIVDNASIPTGIAPR